MTKVLRLRVVFVFLMVLFYIAFVSIVLFLVISDFPPRFRQGKEISQQLWGNIMKYNDYNRYEDQNLLEFYRKHYNLCGRDLENDRQFIIEFIVKENAPVD